MCVLEKNSHVTKRAKGLLHVNIQQNIRKSKTGEGGTNKKSQKKARAQSKKGKAKANNKKSKSKKRVMEAVATVIGGATDKDPMRPLVKVEERDENYDWKGKMLNIGCCVHAFDSDYPCQLAMCPECLMGRKGGRSKRIRKNDASAAVKASSGQKSSGKKLARGQKCRHEVTDFLGIMQMMEDKNYLKHNRIAKAKGNNAEDYEDVVSHCFDCGLRF